LCCDNDAYLIHQQTPNTDFDFQTLSKRMESVEINYEEREDGDWILSIDNGKKQ